MSTNMENVSDLARLLKVIADETRLKILGALADRSLTGKELAARLKLSAPTISHHMRKLIDSGIVTAESDAQRQRYSLNSELLLASRRIPISEADRPIGFANGDGDADARFRAKVIGDFFVGEQLRDIPAQRKRRVIVLQYILERFDPTRTYTEKQINDLLRPAHEDVATLRRELVDYGFMERERGIYQVTRAGPWRDKQVQQEIIGNEGLWLQSLLERVTSSANKTDSTEEEQKQ